MSVVPELLAANSRYADRFDKGDLAMPPGRRVAILTCMDARLLPASFLGLEVISLAFRHDQLVDSSAS